MANRFPQDATGIEGLYSFLLSGQQSATSFPKDRINSDGYYHPDVNHTGTVCLDLLGEVTKLNRY
jgi:acyl transferase domain-containing protein